MRLIIAISVLALRATAAGFDLTWLAPDDCNEQPELAELVGDASGRAEVQLREQDGAWLVTVLFFEPAEGFRRVSVSSCTEAVRTAALLVKLGSRGARPAPTVPEAPLPAPEPVITPPEPAPPSRWRFSLAGGAALDVSSSPAVEPRFALTAGASHALLRLALDVRFGLPFPLADGISAHRLLEVQGAGCLNLEWERLSLAPCLAASAGSWAANTTWGMAATVATAAVGAQVRAFVVIVAGLEAGALAGVRLNLARPQVTANGATLATMPPAAGDFQLTLGWRW